MNTEEFALEDVPFRAQCRKFFKGILLLLLALFLALLTAMTLLALVSAPFIETASLKEVGAAAGLLPLFLSTAALSWLNMRKALGFTTRQPEGPRAVLTRCLALGAIGIWLGLMVAYAFLDAEFITITGISDIRALGITAVIMAAPVFLLLRSSRKHWQAYQNLC